MRREANYRRMLVQSALAILLPTEDLENSCLRTLVTDVIAEVVLGNSIGGKASENWFIWGGIAKLALILKIKIYSVPVIDDGVEPGDNRLERFGLLAGHGNVSGPQRDEKRSSLSSIFWRVVQYAYFSIAMIRFMVKALFATRSGPRRSSTVPRSTGIPPLRTPTSQASHAALCKPLPLIQARLFSLSATLIDLRYRMPWLAGMLSLTQHHLVEGSLSMLGGTDGMLDQ